MYAFLKPLSMRYGIDQGLIVLTTLYILSTVIVINNSTTLVAFKNCEADGISRRHRGILG